MVKQKVKECIEIIKNKFEDNHYLFLNEYDVVCQLYSELLKVDEFSEPQETSSGEKTIALHTEVPFFSRELREGQEPELDRWVDIVILDPPDVTFDREEFKIRKYSSKTYRFEEEKCCIEVKLNTVASKVSCLGEMREDLDKLKILNSAISFMFFLDKRGLLNEADLDELRREYLTTEIIYGKPENN